MLEKRLEVARHLLQVGEPDDSRLKSSHCLAGVPTAVRSSRETRPRGCLPVVASGAGNPPTALSPQRSSLATQTKPTEVDLVNL
ncbi:hypothetical protein GS682_29155 [Nostoc sp. B(2019)]|nr:hypothetical protein [Nostoc sp. B(2019)]